MSVKKKGFENVLPPSETLGKLIQGYNEGDVPRTL